MPAIGGKNPQLRTIHITDKIGGALRNPASTGNSWADWGFARSSRRGKFDTGDFLFRGRPTGAAPGVWFETTGEGPSQLWRYILGRFQKRALEAGAVRMVSRGTGKKPSFQLKRFTDRPSTATPVGIRHLLLRQHAGPARKTGPGGKRQAAQRLLRSRGKLLLGGRVYILRATAARTG